MKKIILTIAVFAVFVLPSAAFAANLGQFATPVNGGGSGPATANAVNNAVTVAKNANAVFANANEYLTFGFSNFKIANPSLSVFKNVAVSVEKTQDLGTFAAVGFSFKF